MKYRLLSFISAIIISFSLHAQNDSTYIYICATDDGNSGLMVSESVNDTETDWNSHYLTKRITSSDFGAWGSGKKMYNPRVFYNAETRTWELLFDCDRNGEVVSYSSSPDLINWTVQEYCHPDEAKKLISPGSKEGNNVAYAYHDKPAHGTVYRVHRNVVDKLKAYQQYVNHREEQFNERSNEDSWRFANIDTISMTIHADPNASKKISDKFIGIFFEDINYAADGGLYAELIQNRDFEYNPTDHHNDIKWNATKGWSLSDSTNMSHKVLDVDPIHPNNPHYLQLYSTNRNAALINKGYDGINIKKGEEYNISLQARSSKATTINVSIVDSKGYKIASCMLKYNTPGKWVNLSGKLSAKSDFQSASIKITPKTNLTIDLDMVSLMPVNTYKGRTNGLRNDLAEALAALKPKFVRFPGGCIAHGDGIDNMYDWKGSIGNLEERIGKRNLWGYHQTRGLGYHEFFVMCEDLGAQPLPVLAAGVPCQNSSTPSHVSHDILTSNGQQCGIPLDEMDAYIADILDLIEYANGDTSTTWGAKRAEAGHEAPFNLKMIGIGNEDLITNAFKERFLLIFNAIKSKYPEIEVVGTVGPFYQGPDYDAGWEFAREYNIPVVDEHYYVSPGWYIHNRDFYEHYDRQGTKVYLGEYASHLPGRVSSLEAALSIALYLTDVERNSDVVTMTSYAPLLAKKGHTQWKPDLIYFDNSNIYLTPDYYVQKMFGNNDGTTYIPTSRTISTNNADANIRLGNSLVIADNGDIILKLVNMTPIVVKTEIPYSNDNTEVTILTGDPNATDAAERTTVQKIRGYYEQPPYSFTVLRFKNNL